MITWISWQTHRRTTELCDYLGIENKVFASKRSRWLKHPIAIMKTIIYLFKERPKTLIVQCPSIFLALIGAILKPVLGYTFIIDAHNAALIPEQPILEKLFFLNKFFFRVADVTVVTNKNLTHVVTAHGGKSFVLPDKLFDPPVLETIPLQSKHNITFVCSFAADESYAEVFEAFRDVPDTTLYVTGRAPQQVLEHYQNYKNITFTGFVPLKDYLTLLRSVDGILALTTRENSILCAANEAVSFAKPMIISDSEYLKNYFVKGTVYTANTATAIRSAYQTFLRDYERLRGEMLVFKPQLSQAWEEQGKTFKSLVYSPKRELNKHLSTSS
jgi:glycosyltransferase involved in cell wall biosynthesis